MKLLFWITVATYGAAVLTIAAAFIRMCMAAKPVHQEYGEGRTR